MNWVYWDWIQSFPVSTEPVGLLQLFLVELCKSLTSLGWPTKQSADNVRCEMEAPPLDLSLLKVIWPQSTVSSRGISGGEKKNSKKKKLKFKQNLLPLNVFRLLVETIH